MGEKKNNKSESGGGESNVTVVLKADLHCEGCVTKVLKCIRSLDGVDSASLGGEQKITVVGKVDPMKLRDKVEKKTHKKFELLSPQSKKDNNKENAKGKENSGGDNVKQEKKKESDDKNSKNKSGEKEKQIPVTTAVLKVHLHCEGCIQKVSKVITKTQGYKEMQIHKDKDLVTVTGAMDMTALAQSLKKHLKKDVEILPQKKDAAEKKEKGGGEKQKSGNEKKEKSGGGDKGKATGNGEKMEANKVQFQVMYPYPYPNPNPYMYGPGVVGEQFYYNPYAYVPYHAPQLFSDENPNACSVM